jgi:hypothetical protein
VAVEGTRNVINAAAGEGVRRVVFTSSYGAVHMDPNRSPDAVLDETCWSDYDFCEKTDVSRHCPCPPLLILCFYPLLPSRTHPRLRRNTHTHRTSTAAPR